MRKPTYKCISTLLTRMKRTGAPVVLSFAVATLIGLHTLPAAATYYCGGGERRVETSIDFGCRGQANPLIDMLFAIIRFLTAGVGIVMIGSFVFAGIQYTTSRGDPQATAAAMKRIRNTLFGLGIYIFAYAILNFLIPAGFFTT